MRRLFLVLLLLVVVPTGVTAQENGTNGTEASVSVDVDATDDCTETIDNLTAICDSHLEEQGDETIAVLVLESKIYQRVTFVDSGAFMRGGNVNRDRGHRLQQGTNTVEFAVTEYQGYYGVSISTNNALYSEPIEQPKPGFLPGEPQSEDPAIAAATVFMMFAVAFPVTYFGMAKFGGGVTREF